MRNITTHRECDRDYNERMTYYRELETQGKKKRSKSRQKKGFWQRAFNGSLGAVSPKVFQRMMKLITVTGLLSKQKLIETIRKLENLSSVLAQRIPQSLLRSQLSKVSQIVGNYGLTETRLFKSSVVKLGIGCGKNSAKGPVLFSDSSKVKKVYPLYSKIVASFYRGKTTKVIHIISQENPCYDCDSFDETLEDMVRPTELVSTPTDTIINSFVKKPSLIEVYKVVNCPKAGLSIQDNNGDILLRVAAKYSYKSLINLLMEKSVGFYMNSNQKSKDPVLKPNTVEHESKKKENEEHIAVSRESLDEPMRQTGVRIVNQLVQQLMDAESQASGSDPNKKHTMPPLVIKGQGFALLKEGGVAMLLDILNKC